MNEFVAGFLMLLPALIAVTAITLVVVASGWWLFSRARAYLPKKSPSAASFLHAGDRRTGRDRRHHSFVREGNHGALAV